MTWFTALLGQGGHVLDVGRLCREFSESYGSDPRVFRAPGRVNLIGEHTDYNGGFVLPMAIDRGTAAAASRRNDRRVRVRSLNFGESLEFDLESPGPRRRGIWLDYVEGVAQALLEQGIRIGGADLAILSDVSMGGGLSSSAALEVAVANALLAVSGANMGKIPMALAGQRAEHEYVGTRCGIMDQFIATLGKAGHALLIDCRSMEAKQIPLELGDASIIICDTRVKHSLASSEYNARRAECERGVELLQQWRPGVTQLRDISQSDLDSHSEALPETVQQRCRHVITENRRTLEAIEALAAGSLSEVGRLMLASHESLRNDYEVSCRELDNLVEAAMSVPGCYGARMTGGGFGGCTVNLVDRDTVETFRASVMDRYRQEFGLEPAVFAVESSDGVAEITQQNP